MIKFENIQNKRYYYLIKNQDILNAWVLTIIRGGTQTRVVRHYGYDCCETIDKEIVRISKIRLRRGYTIVQ